MALNLQGVADQAGNELRVGQGGLAFAVGLDGSPATSEITLDTSVSRVQDSGEPALTVEQINEKLVAAEARRQAALDEVRNRGIEETMKVEKASEHRQQAVEELKEALDAKQENAQANHEAHQEALLERLRKEEIHHEQVLSRRADDFHSRIREMDSRYAEQEGKRNLVLAEVVDKVKEHNDRVKQVHDEMMAHGQQHHVDGDKHASLKKKWIELSSQRDEYLTHAENRIRNENLH